MILGKTVDELPSFPTTPSLTDYLIARDMSLPKTDHSATKKFTFADLIILIHEQRELIVGQAVLLANIPTQVIFPTAFDTTPEVGILRVTQNSVHIGIAIDISSIEYDRFTATAIEDCVLTYIAGKVIPLI